MADRILRFAGAVFWGIFWLVCTLVSLLFLPLDLFNPEFWDQRR